MTLLAKISLELLYVAINIGLGKYEAWRFDIKQQKINHVSWAIAYGVGITLPIIYILFIAPSWTLVWLWLAGVAIHFPLFSAALNFFRIPRRPWDYHNIADVNGSKWDLWLGKRYAQFWFGSIAAWVALQFLIFKS